MPLARRRLLIAAAVLTGLVLITWACGLGGGNGDDPAPPVDTDAENGETDDDPGADDDAIPEPPAFVPVTGGTGEDGQPEPPPVHATFSVVVRGDTSWAPYPGPELGELDDAVGEEAGVIAGRVRQMERTLSAVGVPASIEFAYGPAAAICAVDPELFTELADNGHSVGLHARSPGEAFRVHEALETCGVAPSSASGLGEMADRIGPDGPTPERVREAFAVLGVLDVRQVVGEASPVCVEVGLAGPTHGYGTGAFTAPWRSGWTEDAPCTDLPRGRIVVIDQAPFAPADGVDRIDEQALSPLGSRTDQILAYALDLRFADVGDLPAPGVITWGVTVRLDDFIAPDPALDDPDGDVDDGNDGELPAPSPDAPDPRTAPLSEDTLTRFAEFVEERWAPSVEQGRMRWMLPDDIAEILRPTPETD